MAEYFADNVAAVIQVEAVSVEHFPVDGTLIQAWGLMKSVRPKNEKSDDPPTDGGSISDRWVDLYGEKRSSDKHHLETDSEARLARKAKAQSSILADVLLALMRNRSGSLVGVRFSEANATAESPSGHQWCCRDR